MNYKEIEDLFINFILYKLGPNKQIETERNNNLKTFKYIISQKLEKRLPDYIIHIQSYGSFPTKTYLKDADIDITIFFESKLEKKVLTNIPYQIQDKAIQLIKEECENCNKESTFELITDIRVIMAKIRLIKCKIGSINIDISINNFSGLFKILFIDLIEKQFESQFIKKNLFEDSVYKENKINIFRRSLLLIKAWFFYEGELIGSSIGLMANYTLEILVIFLFNLHYDKINNEFDAFVKFFELMNEFNWDKNIISIYGIIPNFDEKLENFNKKVVNEKGQNNKDLNNTIYKPLWYLENILNDNEKENSKEAKALPKTNSEPLLNEKELKNFIYSINNILKNLELLNEENFIDSNNFKKEINILDPLNNHNNLGKSINTISKSKMKLTIIYIINKLKKIQEKRKIGNPLLYMNSLLNLFRRTIINIYGELFANSLNNPEIIINSSIYKKFNKIKKRQKIIYIYF